MYICFIILLNEKKYIHKLYNIILRMGRVEIFALKTHGILKSKMITLRAFNSTKVKVICLLFFQNWNSTTFLTIMGWQTIRLHAPSIKKAYRDSVTSMSRSVVVNQLQIIEQDVKTSNIECFIIENNIKFLVFLYGHFFLQSIMKYRSK